MSQSIIAGIDIGNANIKTIIADITEESGTPRIIGIGSTPSNGLRRGVVVDMEEVIKSIRQSVAKAQGMAQTTITRAYVGLTGLHIKTQQSKGVVAVSRADNEISQNDIDRVIDAASTVSLPPNYEILHVVPRNFIIDGQEEVKNPLGMKGVRLEVEVLLIEGMSPYIHNLTKCINANGIEVAELVFAPLAVSKAVLNKHQREYGSLVLDIGGGVTSLALFHEGDLLHTAVLPVGSRHITNDLAIALRTSLENAERIKLDFGYVGQPPEPSNKNDMVDLASYLGEEEFKLPRKHIAKIIEARISELYDVISNELKKTPGKQLLPAGLVLAGGGANLPGIEAESKERVGLATTTGATYRFQGLSHESLDPSFAVAIGLVMWGMEREPMEAKQRFSGIGKTGSLFKKGLKLLKNFLP